MSRGSKSGFDPLNPMMGQTNKRFYHPHVKEQSASFAFRNKAFEMAESVYFCIGDLIEGIINFFGRFFFGLFYIIF